MTNTDPSAEWPSELRLTPEKNELKITFAGGFSAALSAEYLRVFSPSAEVQGHSPQSRQLEVNKQNVQITKIEPVGNYAVRLTFSDGHNTGIYSWRYLHEIAKNREALWRTYLKELQEAGLTRS